LALGRGRRRRVFELGQVGAARRAGRHRRSARSGIRGRRACDGGGRTRALRRAAHGRRQRRPRGGAPGDGCIRVAPAARAGRGVMSDGPGSDAHADETRDDAPRDSRRMFFALWPDAETRVRLARATKDAVRRSGGRPIAKDRFHVTVAFLGNLTPAGFEIASAVPPIPVGAFTLVLDTIGAFASSRTLWLGSRSVPPALVELERRLWEALAAKGFIREERIYRPHVTLARRARVVDEEIVRVEWPVAELALVE